MRIALLISILCAPAWAQEHWDMGLLFGAAGTSSVVVAATPTQAAGSSSGSVGWNWQWTSAFLLHSNEAGKLNWYAEVPLTFFHAEEVADIERVGDYFTPGIRLKIATKTRISFYGVVGGGWAQYNEKDALLNGQLTAAADAATGHPAADVGGGIDLRLNQFVSLRLDGRDYITPPGFGGTTGRNHPLFAAGIAFH
jgi:hypothetical protein